MDVIVYWAHFNFDFQLRCLLIPINEGKLNVITEL